MLCLYLIYFFQSLHLLQQNNSQNGGNPPSNPGNSQQQNPAQATPTPQQLGGNPNFFQGASPAMLQALLSQQQGGNHSNPIFPGIPPTAVSALNPNLPNITDVCFCFFLY